MSKAINAAKITLAFVIIAGGISLIIGSLMGGGLSRDYEKLRGINKDPRSIFVQGILFESDSVDSQSATLLPTIGSQQSDVDFAALLSEVDQFRGIEGVRIRTPSLLVQHAEMGSVTINLGNQLFDASVSPSVIDTKHGSVLRVAIQIQRTDTDSAANSRELIFSTAYTTSSGDSMLLDLADLGLPGTRTILALRTTLHNPTPIASN